MTNDTRSTAVEKARERILWRFGEIMRQQVGRDLDALIAAARDEGVAALPCYWQWCAERPASPCQKGERERCPSCAARGRIAGGSV